MTITTQTPTARREPLYRVVETSEHEATLTTRSGLVIHYWRPRDGGYVRQVSDRYPGTSGSQVCDGLAGSGDTLYQQEGRSLAALIRREARSVAGRANIEACDQEYREELESAG